MADPTGPLHTAIEAALRASTDLATAMGGKVRLYTEAPTNASLPYVVIGQYDGGVDRSGCADEADITATVTLWSRTTPLDHGVQARAMGDAVLEAIGVDLTVTGWDVMVREDDLRPSYSTQADTSTRGVLVIEYRLTEQVA
jgi:hypothetical protein